MSEFKKCAICGKYDFAGSHKCPPRWEVCARDIGEWEPCYALDEEEAAKEFAEEYDSDDHAMMSGDNLIVLVRKHEGGDVKTYNCLGEASPTYTAHLLLKDTPHD